MLQFLKHGAACDSAVTLISSQSVWMRPHFWHYVKWDYCFSFRILCLTKTKQRDKQSSAMLEKKTRAETEARLSVEKQLSELQAQKLEEAAITARSLTNRSSTAVRPAYILLYLHLYSTEYNMYGQTFEEILWVIVICFLAKRKMYVLSLTVEPTADELQFCFKSLC